MSKFKKNQTIACLGDSITCNNFSGYPEYLQKYMDKEFSHLNLTFLNWGLNEETLTGPSKVDSLPTRPFLFDRLDNLLNGNTKPDIIIFCYGMYCGLFGEPSEEIFCAYEDNLRYFLDRMKKEQIKVILLTPPPLALDSTKATKGLGIGSYHKNYDLLHPYLYYDEEVIQEFMCTILFTTHPVIWDRIDIHTPLINNKELCYGKDPVHPNIKGHEVIASEIIKNFV